MSEYANNMKARAKAARREADAAARAAAGLPSEQTVREALHAMTLDKVPAWADVVMDAVRRSEYVCPACKGDGNGPTVMVGDQEEPAACPTCGGSGVLALASGVDSPRGGEQP